MKMSSDRQIIAFKKSGSLNLMAMSWKPVDSSLCVCTAWSWSKAAQDD